MFNTHCICHFTTAIDSTAYSEKPELTFVKAASCGLLSQPSRALTSSSHPFS